MAREDISDIRYAIGGPPLLLGGVNTSGKIHQDKVAPNGFGIMLNPNIDQVPFSAMGRNIDGVVIQVSMRGKRNLQREGEMYIPEIASLMRELWG